MQLLEDMVDMSVFYYIFTLKTQGKNLLPESCASSNISFPLLVGLGFNCNLYNRTASTEELPTLLFRFSNCLSSQGFGTSLSIVHVRVDAAARPCAQGCPLSSWFSRLENKGRLNLSTRLNITAWQWTYGVKQRLCSFSKGVGRKASVIDSGWQWDTEWQSGRT